MLRGTPTTPRCRRGAARQIRTPLQLQGARALPRRGWARGPGEKAEVSAVGPRAAFEWGRARHGKSCR
eukprot:scaffold200_cov401-Prasinococcus_capsulatus_cf.AAC.12